MKGLDYAWHGAINWSCFVSNGVKFIMRYFSYDPSKDLSASELRDANAHGISVGVVWETTANRMLSGYNGGVTDATQSLSRANALGMTGIPIYFACDWDASESEQSMINSYMDGVAHVIGKNRAGIYAGYWPGKRTMDAGKATYLWQTYAWSGGNWDSRAQLRQVQNGVTVCGTSSDWDESHSSDFGQWPRPSGQLPPLETPIQPEQIGEIGMVEIPPNLDGHGPDTGFSFTAHYQHMGLCADPGRMGNNPVIVRIALHNMQTFNWDVKTVNITSQNPKVVVDLGGKYDGASFMRQDRVPITLYPNFA